MSLAIKKRIDLRPWFGRWRCIARKHGHFIWKMYMKIGSFWNMGMEKNGED